MSRGCVVGIDLAGSVRRNTGYCALHADGRCETRVLHTDEEIIAATMSAGPAVVAVDAPLFLPLGRKSLKVPGTQHLRECDRQLLAMGIRFLPVSLGPMRMLTERGIALKGRMELEGLSVIETYPGGAQDIMGLPRKRADLASLQSGLSLMVRLDKTKVTHDELDAITCAIVGRMYLQGKHRSLGRPDEGLMILPAQGF